MSKKHLHGSRGADSARRGGASSDGPADPKSIDTEPRKSLDPAHWAERVVAKGEPVEEFDELKAGYLERYQPEGPIETDLVEEIVACRWRIRRIWHIEAHLLSGEGPGLVSITNLQTTLRRFETSLVRQEERAQKLLVNMQLKRRQNQGKSGKKGRSNPGNTPYLIC